MNIILPQADGSLAPFTLSGAAPFAAPVNKSWNRIAYSAAHLTINPLAGNDPWITTAVDWETTLAFRHRLWSLGLGVAEAMDTAQRGMGVDWATSLELIQRASAEARAFGPGALIASGAGTDHLDLSREHTIDEIIAAYEMQCEAVEAAGSRVILMASRALNRAAKTPEDYARVYGRVLSGLRQPAILHWLGEMFDPALEGYWGGADHWQSMEHCLAMMRDNAAKIEGIKVSLLSEEKEVAMRRQLPEGVSMYTGDDFNYPSLIQGDGSHSSHALLGIFDPIAPAAAAALEKLTNGDAEGFRAIMDPTVPLSRLMFAAPTRFYKTGVVFLAWLNGNQKHFTMAGGQESARSTLHLAELFRLADAAGLLEKPELALARMKALMLTRGVEA
ncbi:dihydrodipicolinate synthase family protein [Xinfangfangia sp. CPCC 101601]|uniref:Dihydrodipicolinate synthase family protein n=1 Tax=Pseudogemmobacter lacusdianii TaxID=3069608 RepID=A0ABU0VSY6_9RHOB|nr:dihydrodipicolinate synthase family protein [Xinfangfangia sp. CPCC 101601]MDQ2064837.1 dihydrodipicolinate synthase family protein [Xinfangfangia sp. CPCC 101601]